MTTLKTLALLTLIACAGCSQVDGYRAIQDEFPGCKLNRPYVMDTDYGWVMQDSTGGVWWVEHEGRQVRDKSAATYLFSPLTVTQAVDRVVTQECSRPHWPEQGKSILLPMPQIPSNWLKNLTNNFSTPLLFGEQKHDERAVVYSNVTYVVKVEYGGVAGYSAVAGVENQPHYDALFTVYLNGQQISSAMLGQYTGWKCFEDSPPEKWVIKALTEIVTNYVGGVEK